MIPLAGMEDVEAINRIFGPYFCTTVAACLAVVIGTAVFIGFRREEQRKLRRRRQSRGLCPTCGYDLRASVPGTCLECGERAAGNDANAKMPRPPS